MKKRQPFTALHTGIKPFFSLALTTSSNFLSSPALFFLSRSLKTLSRKRRVKYRTPWSKSGCRRQQQVLQVKKLSASSTTGRVTRRLFLAAAMKTFIRSAAKSSCALYRSSRYSILRQPFTKTREQIIGLRRCAGYACQKTTKTSFIALFKLPLVFLLLLIYDLLLVL